MMKEAFVIIRFGDNEPLEEDIAAINAICGEDNLDGQMGMPLPIGIMSMVYTESTIEDISKVYNILMDETGEILPFMVFKLYDSSVSFDFCLHKINDKISFNGMKEAFEKHHGLGESKVQYSMDDLLDRISQVGMEGLTEVEKFTLKELTKNNS